MPLGRPFDFGAAKQPLFERDGGQPSAGEDIN
jgi:hypothetical protein